ncbi:hypothetical protein P3T76_014859 [Phytophthora citrophthora]|uniref:Uncharacterized protein n=1 Tax=Phytophthora citrophthora TaxID=4793 RepID=A0AAD9G0G1_9STRA|nr:hypothetical protein P3T76_014859 [Phytophthora citrophthora]
MIIDAETISTIETFIMKRNGVDAERDLPVELCRSKSMVKSLVGLRRLMLAKSSTILMIDY